MAENRRGVPSFRDVLDPDAANGLDADADAAATASASRPRPALRFRTTSTSLATPIADVLGTATAAQLNKAFGMTAVGDLVSHYPRRYGRHGELTTIADIPLDEPVTFQARVVEASSRSMQTRKGTIQEVRITDGTDVLPLTFFNSAWRLTEGLRAGASGVFAGTVTLYKGGRQLTHPDYQLDDPTDDGGLDAEGYASRPVPIYSATASIPSWKLQKFIASTLDELGDVSDPIPADTREGRKLLPYRSALEYVHRPEEERDYHVARHTLRFAEALILQTELLRRREAVAARPAAARPARPGGLLDRFDAQLAFTLTGDQRAVGADIAGDLAGTRPMSRLLQGEVGSGKTLVALRAMLQVAETGGQTALLAPTEVLAAQHLRSIVTSLGPDLAAELVPTLLTGQLPVKQRRAALLRAASGQSALVIGTHALLGDTVSFAELGLVIVDEQHRFGVEQRETLRGKGDPPPHLLVLTATPIPRTIAMTVFGDLETSTIRELPRGRSPIASHVVPRAENPTLFGRTWDRLAEEVRKGRQGFVVCPAIGPKQAEPAEEPLGGEDETTPKTPPASVEDTLEHLQQRYAGTGIRLAALHGRMSADEKDAIMRSFAAREIDVLVSTTVIEVGVDVPNASTMVVLDADRFGVSQLHQLRGRVGRGSVPGLCLFVTDAEAESLARERVDAVAATLDGFELAQVDLELRREGDVLGANQSGGRSSLKLLRVAKDGKTIAEARAEGERLLAADPTLAEHPGLLAAIERRVAEAEVGFLEKA